MSQKTNFFSSLKFKIMLVLAGCGTALVVSLVLASVLKTQNNLEDLMHDYLLDEAKAVGMCIDHELADDEKVLQNYEEINSILAGIQISDFESSYAYLVDARGTMLYHPDQGKVGQPVENSVVKGVVDALAAGNTVEPESEPYEYRGVKKYAAYYVGADNQYVLVITADEDDAFAAIDEMMVVMLGVGVAVTVVLIFVAGFIIIMVFKKIDRIARLMGEISEGDFTDKPEYTTYVKRKDEVGNIARSASNLRESLHEALSVVQKDVAALEADSDELNENMQQAKNSTEGISVAMDELSQGAMSMAENVQDTAGVLGRVDEVVNAALQETQKSTKVLEESVTISKEAREELTRLSEANDATAHATTQVVQGINESNEAIAKIEMATQIIMALANQTNLLSLNASIEAARAGEAGRGFAVVAGEIKNLAEQSDKSAQDIQAIIELIMEKAKANTEFAEEIQKAITDEKEAMSAVVGKFEAVEKNVTQTMASFEEIDAMVKELDEGKVKVMDAVEQLSSISEENAASSQETNAATQELDSVLNNIAADADELAVIAAELNEQVKKFKLN